MELRQFITTTLVDIVEGVTAAQGQTPKGTIVPENIEMTAEAIECGASRLQPVEFEVTVRADESQGSEAKLSVVTAFIGGGVKGESGSTGGHSATLKFRIPIHLPESRFD